MQESMPSTPYLGDAAGFADEVGNHVLSCRVGISLGARVRQVVGEVPESVRVLLDAVATAAVGAASRTM
jgi:hypothetical protein